MRPPNSAQSSFRPIRPLFWLFILAFNLVGTADLILDYHHAIQVGLPALAGQLDTTYAIPIIYVPVLMITTSPRSICCCVLSPRRLGSWRVPRPQSGVAGAS